ncbi:MAG: DUF2029 domain-containing protein [Anaerolineales bacterium]|uniref:DUF2029 domain-containing protein n=1 Tax=Candidatus Desulfolinea nitratireducens TaxID=2841698 RepID=A0A8J6NGU0_9CHLR|nr:DUF2029 domain-containing protein [Candidatus Desulfolinea nitratireducens]MBL6960211.1 DUF2029 domain-containing protein [Anaerolineales bacterium]
MTKKIWGGILVILIIISLFIAAQSIATKADYINNDFLVFWLAGYSNWVDIDPYNASDWINARIQFGSENIPEPEFLYPLPLAVFLAPLGLLNLHQAFTMWVFLSACLIIISISIILRFGKTHPQIIYLAIPFLLFSPLFPPTLITLFLGQLSAVLLLFASLAIYFWQQRKWFWGGFFIAFFTLKPSIGLPLLALTTLWLLNKKQFKAISGIISASLLLLIIGLIKDPLWISKYLAIGSNKISNTFGFSPTIWGISGLSCDFDTSCTIIFGLIGILTFLAINIWLLFKWKDASLSLEYGQILIVSLLSAPYLWPYDQLLLLIPIFLGLITLIHQGFSPIKTILIFILISFFAIGLGLTANILEHPHENLYVLLSIIVWGMNTWILYRVNIEKRSSAHSEKSEINLLTRG